MKYELPNHLKLNKKENKEIEQLTMSFFNGLLFFITAPLWIYKKIKKRKNANKMPTL